MQSGDAVLDTMPKLLARNVQKFGNSPAFREKDLGIWQSWNWNQNTSTIITWCITHIRFNNSFLYNWNYLLFIWSNRNESSFGRTYS